MNTKPAKILKAFFIIISFLAVNILIDALTSAFVPMLMATISSKPVSESMSYVVYGLLAGQIVKALILFFFIKRRKKKFNKEYYTDYIKNDRIEKPLRFVGIGLGTVGFGLILTNLIMKSLEGTQILQNALDLMENAFSGQGTIYGLVVLLVVVIGAPLVEALLFRGVLFEELDRVVSRKTTIILTALIFGIYHFNILQTPNTVVMGLVLAFAYQRTRSIKAPIIIHATNNILATIPIIDQGFTPLGFVIYGVFLIIGIYSLKTLRQTA